MITHTCLDEGRWNWRSFSSYNFARFSFVVTIAGRELSEIVANWILCHTFGNYSSFFIQIVKECAYLLYSRGEHSHDYSLCAIHKLFIMYINGRRLGPRAFIRWWWPKGLDGPKVIIRWRPLGWNVYHLYKIWTSLQITQKRIVVGMIASTIYN